MDTIGHWFSFDDRRDRRRKQEKKKKKQKKLTSDRHLEAEALGAEKASNTLPSEYIWRT
jgi:hypothetical protein